MRSRPRVTLRALADQLGLSPALAVSGHGRIEGVKNIVIAHGRAERLTTISPAALRDGPARRRYPRGAHRAARDLPAADDQPRAGRFTTGS
jgi:hypothetical protein